MKAIKQMKWWLLAPIFLGAVLATFFLPLPYYISVPGGAEDIRGVLTVNDQEDQEKGAYDYVAIQQGQASLASVIYAWLSPFTEVIPQEEMTGDHGMEDYWRMSQFYMETSQNTAIYQALKLAGKEVSLTYQGVYVLDVSEDSTFKDTLRLADTVTGVNGQTFSSSKELITYVSSLGLGDQVTVQYTSDDEKKTATGKIIKLSNGKNGIGIGLVDHTEVATDIPIVFETENLGGPSAGLMFTLAIYDQLVDEDLRKGRVIAGTGTIEMDATVGDIGGAGLKVVAAHEAGAEIFFVPDNPVDPELLKKDPSLKTNYEEALEAAKQLKTKMVIVPVKTLDEAVTYLRTH